ncbi:MAG: lipid-A-disaccharide synthase [Candidatus Neomarinimicrobiota bacterium]
MIPNVKKYFIIAGEPSGDLHGSKLIMAIKSIDPNTSFMGHGGNNMKKAGLQLIEDIDKLSIMGFFEVIKHLPRFKKILSNTVEIIKHSKPDRVILIDYPGFNLRLAKKIAHFNIPITYFILPQAWAWKENRVNIIKKFIDQSISIFPFEKEWYKSKNLQVDYLGHPFMDLEHVNETSKSFYNRHSLKINYPILTLLPGSRQQEIDKHWPVFLETVRLIKKKVKDIQIIIGKSSNITIPNCPEDFRIEKNARKAIIAGTVALVSSGTTNLECAIEDTPIVVCYKLNLSSWILAKLLVKIKFSSIVNIIAGKLIVQEFLQNKMKPKALSKEIINLLNVESKKHQNMINEFKKIKKLLGSPGVYNRIAELILNKT